MRLERVLRPKSIAAIGGLQAGRVVEQCKLMGFEGEIWPVHPTRDEVHGLQAYRLIEDLPGPPDAAFIGVNRHLTIEVVRRLRDIGCGGGVCFAAGYMEADETGGELQSDLIEAAGDMPLLGPNCYGYINYADGALLWPDQQGGKRLDSGKTGVAIIAQSSNIAINFTMQKRGLPLAYIFYRWQPGHGRYLRDRAEPDGGPARDHARHIYRGFRFGRRLRGTGEKNRAN